MSPKHWYLLLSILGAILSLAEFVPWTVTNGLDLPLFAKKLFANRVSSFFALDVILSACALFAFISVENRRKRIAWWIPVIVTLILGVSAGLPLMFYLLEKSRSSTKSEVQPAYPGL